MIFSFVAILFFFGGTAYALPANEANGAWRYLQKFGYLDETVPGIFTEYESVSSANLDFKKIAGLAEKEEVKGETIDMMNIPRCGLMYKGNREESNRPLTGLGYHIKKYPVSVKDVANVGQEIAKAFKIWEDVTESCFKDETIGQLDITINFDTTESGGEKSSAHTFFPKYDSADITENQPTDEKISLKSVDIAEEKFDHLLDLTDVMKKKRGLMIAHAEGYKSQEDEDVNESINAPDICEDASLDTITRTKDGSTYAFKGDFCWKIFMDRTVDGYPKRIADDFDGLEGNLDASFTDPHGKTFFFKEKQYWRFTNKKMDSGYPKLISEGFPGIPDNLDAALIWGNDRKPYFFKDDLYWQYDVSENPPVTDVYPLSITDWNGLPIDGIDAAFVWENNASYFFSGGIYYRFEEGTYQVSTHFNYPASTAVSWFTCEDRSENFSDEDNSSGLSMIQITDIF